MRKLHHWSICAALLALSVVVPACAGTITVCQCNIYVGGRYTEQDTSAVTYDTAKRFAQWVASINPSGGTNPPIAVIGMQELISETDRAKIEQLLEQYTGADWAGSRTPQGVNNASGIGFFWRTDLVEHRLSEWYLGEKVLETIDNGYVLKYAGRLFRKLGTDEAFGLFTGKLLWGGAILNGHEVTEEERRQEAIRLKEWIVNGQAGSPGMSGFPGTARVITNDLNTDTGTSTWNEMDLEFTDPSSQHTHNSFSGQTMMDWFGKRLDYIWWDRDSGVKQPGGFAINPTRSSHFGSDHRAVYATINLHAVDLTLPAVSVTAPAAGGRCEEDHQRSCSNSREPHLRFLHSEPVEEQIAELVGQFARLQGAGGVAPLGQPPPERDPGCEEHHAPGHQELGECRIDRPEDARVDTAFDNPPDEDEQSLEPLHRLLAHVRPAARYLAEDDRRGDRIAEGHRDEVPDRPAQHFARIAVLLEDLLEHGSAAHLDGSDHRVVQGLLVAHVIVEHGLVRAGTPRDLIYPCAVEALLGEHLGCGLADDLLLDLLRQVPPDLVHRGRRIYEPGCPVRGRTEDVEAVEEVGGPAEAEVPPVAVGPVLPLSLIHI